MSMSADQFFGRCVYLSFSGVQRINRRWARWYAVDSAPGATISLPIATGNPTGGIAFGTDGRLPGPTIGASGAVVGSTALPADSTDYRELAVPAGGFLNLYVMVAAGTANPVFEGPYE